ncbi:MAG: hypothetical protein HY658_10420 [Actinobacteria bacterium]|nr:hypothetical protein [Actinomycetota bacterium]
MPGGGPGEEGGAGGPPIPGSLQTPPLHGCCWCGIWIGVGIRSGGMLFLVGYESLLVVMYCACDPSKSVTLEFTSWRLGVGLGGEAGAAVVVVQGEDHATGVAEQVKKKVAGIGGDLSVGIPISKLAKVGVKGKKIVDVVKALDAAYKAERAANPQLLKWLLKEAAQGAATGGGASAGGDVIEDLKGDEPLPDDFVIPLGPGLQAGLWYNPEAWTSVEVNAIECCTCD